MIDPIKLDNLEVDMILFQCTLGHRARETGIVSPLNSGTYSLAEVAACLLVTRGNRRTEISLTRSSACAPREEGVKGGDFYSDTRLNLTG